MSPSCYCIKCITCCLCFSAVAAVPFPPCKLNSNAETCLEKSPWLCVLLGLVHGPCGSRGFQLGVWKVRDSTLALDELGQPAGRKYTVQNGVTRGLLHWVRAVNLCSVSWPEEWVYFIYICKIDDFQKNAVSHFCNYSLVWSLEFLSFLPIN